MSNIRCPGCMRQKQQPICEHCGWDERRENASHQLPIGTVLKEQYRIGRALGQGGFGITYLGWDLYLDMPVAIKEYYPSSTVMRDSAASLSVASYGGEVGARFRNCKERFLREAKILARLSEVPEIVRIRNFFESNNTAYIVMEFVKGVTLKDYVKSKGGKLSMEETLSILYPVMEGLCKVHQAGLVHRDISPDNIMLQPQGRAKLIDFGAVRDVGHADKEAPLTKSTEAILKQGYAPIEQYQNRGSLGPWTDVYAMCATIYYCITGRVPIDAPGRMLDDEGLKIRQLAPELSEAFEKVLEQGMALRTVNRISSMEELLEKLKNPEPEQKEPPIIISDPPKPEKRKSKLPLLAVLLLAAVIGLFVLIPRESAEPVMAEPPVQTAAPTEQATEQSTEPPAPTVSDRWEDHILQQSPIGDRTIDEYAEMDVFSSPLKRKDISSVTFLDSTETVPVDAWDISEAKDSSVMAWTEPNGALYDLYIAGNGGLRASESCAYLFAGYIHMESITFNNAFHMGPATSTRYMFFGCSSLKELSLSGLDTSNVTDMSAMFSGCSALEALNVERLNTDMVTDMSRMFENCSGLTELELKRFETASVTNMGSMFSGCENLRSLDLTNFDTALVTDMSFMFYRCCNLESIDILVFDTDNVTTMESMFECCCTLTELDVSGNADPFGSYHSFVTYRVANMQRMFAGCTNLRRIIAEEGFRFEDTNYRKQNFTDIILDCPYLTLAKSKYGDQTIKSK